MDIQKLITGLTQANQYFSSYAVKQVNTSLTLRNWVMGLYIVEYEQQGADRAQYGDGLLSMLAAALRKAGIKGVTDRYLRSCRSFYTAYPQIWMTVSSKSDSWLREAQLPDTFLVQDLVDNFGNNFEIAPGIQATNADLLLSRLNYSHFIELLKADTALKRTFYEVQAIKNSWSIRDLRRAMDSMLYERTGLSTDKEALLSKLTTEIQPAPQELVMSPYVLEFLGLEEKAEYSESDLEQAIINHLQQFLMEAGRGFCFEARQKRITFDNTHYRIDLVFYHRILKCHVLVDLKLGEFSHADAGQMNVYLNYYQDQEMTPGDNPPIGIILCAHKNDALVKYATVGLSQQMFVSKYLVNLPKEEELAKLIREEQAKNQ
jgi:predicted nuclease of restriction endonuclease-like (RecB) superfamily